MAELVSVPEPASPNAANIRKQPLIAYIHAGTHKTGTTYLQRFFTLNQSILDRAGLYIPRTGRIGPIEGHHNLAWELYGDHRYTAAHGTLADLVNELQSLGSPTFCISSEDFEFLHRYPDALHRLRDTLRSLGYTCKPIFYLRPQVDYAESLYRELLKHGSTIEFDEFFRTFTAGEFTLYDKWHFSSDYLRLLDAYAAVFGKSNIVVRRYSRRAADEIVIDFLSQVFASGALPQEKFQHRPEPINTALSPAEMFRLFLLNKQGAPENPQNFSDQATQPELPERFEPLCLSNIARACRQLGWSNRKVLTRYGVFVPVVSPRRLAKCTLASAGIGRYARFQKLSRQMFADHSKTRSASAHPLPTKPSLARQPASNATDECK